jgi:hypothetical protein
VREAYWAVVCSNIQPIFVPRLLHPPNVSREARAISSAGTHNGPYLVEDHYGVQAVGDYEAGGVIQPRPDSVLDQAVVRGRECMGVGSADIY